MSDLALTSAGRLPQVGASEFARLRAAATQFEAAFLQQVMKPLSEGSLDEQPLIGGDSASTSFKGLYHQGLSEQVAGGLGIADLVLKELSVRAGLPAPDDDARKGTTP